MVTTPILLVLYTHTFWFYQTGGKKSDMTTILSPSSFSLDIAMLLHHTRSFYLLDLLAII